MQPADLLATAARARDIVMETERRLGFEPTDSELDKLGYDIESLDPATGKLRFIEVKGRRSDADTVTVTKNEILYSLNKPDDFILALVLFGSGGDDTPRALRPAAVPAGTGLRGGERQLRAQGPAGQCREPAAGRAGGRFDRACLNGRDTTPGGSMPPMKVTVSPCPFRRGGAWLFDKGAVDGLLSGGGVRGVRYAADDVVPDRSAELRAGGRGEVGRCSTTATATAGRFLTTGRGNGRRAG